MYEEGERIRYMMPLEHDYTYGVISELRRGVAVVKLEECLNYPKGAEIEVPYRFLEHLGRSDRYGSGTYKNSE